MAPRKVTVFGGTGFLGRRVVQRLLERDFSVRVAVRHPERIAALFPALHLDAILADVETIAPLPLPSRVSRAS
jgi:uncharacterized protein YbjT (DUF2867 family)